MSDTTKPPSAAAPIEVTQAESVRVEGEAPFYTATGIQAAGSVWALNVSFMSTQYAGNKVVERPQVTIALPWGLAKALHTILGETITAYEALEGQIVLPKSFTDKRK